MGKALTSAVLMVVLGAVTAVAAEIEPLDGAFLEYLANLEADDADWTLLAPAEPAESESKPSAGVDAKSATESTEARKPKEAAKPAVEKR